ncbi:MAG: transglycosylase domain-containing protein [Actinomycetaceae bacterium]|nr:transglycosylase domain-containing protein [Actinomycetaceae bacterium]
MNQSSDRPSSRIPQLSQRSDKKKSRKRSQKAQGRPQSTPASTKKKKTTQSKKKHSQLFIWTRRIFTTFFSLLLLAVIAASALFLYAYWKVEVPSPNKVAQAQITTVYYADGKTEMGTFAERNRKIVDVSQLPKHIGYAVVASEDRTFWQNNGVDFKGIIRALWNNVQGKPLQGASTLSQQYIENYYVGSTRSYVGKFKETILALKINRQQSKEEILENYLNTIYFGRGAYGIEAAAQAYFDKPASKLDVSESALLAGIIPAPSLWDPQINKDKAHMRWKRVIDHMVADGWLKKSDAKKIQFPEVIEKKQQSSSFVGTKGYILQHVRSELQARAGYSLEDIDTLGLKIVTTIQPDIQKKMEESVAILPDSKPQNLRVGMSAITPQTGEIVAEYGGEDYLKIQSSAVTQDIAMAGSTFKPFTLVAALEQGIDLDTVVSGSANMQVNGETIWNYGHVGFGNINLIQATKNSVNTAFVRLNEKVGPEAARLAAIRAGFPEDTAGLNNELLNTLGTCSPHNLNLTEAYATFANEGVHVKAHVVSQVTDLKGKVLYKADTKGSRVFQSSVIAQLDKALQEVANGGTGKKAAAVKRPVALKTGSSNDNRSAQVAGYIPQLAVSVSLYQVGKDGGEESITPFGGVDEVTGGTWPTQIWTEFMKSATVDMEIQKFPEPSKALTKQKPEYKIPSYETAPPLPKPKETRYDVVIPRISQQPEPSQSPDNNQRQEQPQQDNSHDQPQNTEPAEQPQTG